MKAIWFFYILTCDDFQQLSLGRGLLIKWHNATLKPLTLYIIWKYHATRIALHLSKVRSISKTVKQFFIIMALYTTTWMWNVKISVSFNLRLLIGSLPETVPCSVVLWPGMCVIPSLVHLQQAITDKSLELIWNVAFLFTFFVNN